MPKHLIWISLALAGCVTASKYNTAIEENRRLRLDLAAAVRAEQGAEAEFARVRTEKETAEAELRRQVERAGAERDARQRTRNRESGARGLVEVDPATLYEATPYQLLSQP